IQTVYFFTSRRRHTRSLRDWSSDVCSSDLARRNARAIHAPIQQNLIRSGIVTAELPPPAPRAPSDVRTLQLPAKVFPIELIEKQIGRASCREGELILWGFLSLLIELVTHKQ